MRQGLGCFSSSITMLWLAVAAVADAAPSSQRPVRRALPVAEPVEAVGPREAKTSSRPSTIIVIDPGHGGHDRGGIPGQRIAEKNMTLDVARRLRSLLMAGGYRVVMTRDSDVFVPLPTRIATANSYRNAIFVSIHFNSARRRGANGIETYFYNRESLPLASAVHYYVAGGAPSPNRGVRRRGYYVLRKARVPAVLVECGFLTNPTDAEYVQVESYRQKLAEQITRGIRSRGSVARVTSSTQLAANSAVVPLQPFIDQTRLRDPDLRSKRSSKRSAKYRSSKKKKRTSVASKKSAKKRSSGSEQSRKEPSAGPMED